MFIASSGVSNGGPVKGFCGLFNGPRGLFKEPWGPGKIDPGTLRSTGRARETNLHQTSAPETNSKAVSCPFHILGVPRRLPDSGLRDGGLVIR